MLYSNLKAAQPGVNLIEMQQVNEYKGFFYIQMHLNSYIIYIDLRVQRYTDSLVWELQLKNTSKSESVELEYHRMVYIRL
jgi:hypothetical protein